MELTVATWVFVTVFGAITLMSILDDRQKLNALDRFRRYVAMEIAAGEDRRKIDRTFQQRIIQPMIERTQAIINTRVSESVQGKLKLKLLNAGYSLRTTPGEYMIKSAGQVLLLGFVTVAGLLYYHLVEKKLDQNQVMSYSVLAILGFGLLQPMQLREKADKRRELIERELPELLDYIQVAVEAGLSIDSAIERIVTERPKSVSAGEFKIYLHDVKMGLQRAEALQQLTLRTNSKYVKSFTDGVTQAVKTGMPIANILQIIRKDIYDDIRSRAEKRAYKAPVLMMIPMVIFIFPTVFIITLGPAVLKLMAEMANF